MNEGEHQRGRFLLSNEELLHLYETTTFLKIVIRNLRRKNV